MHKRAYNQGDNMRDYEWDPHKAKLNLQKHRISFTDAVTVFGDEYAITIEDDHPEENRYVVLGKDAKGRLLVVVFTFRGKRIRIISARKATSLESAAYQRA
jgi:uncharacterized DUF497 family protein